VRALDLLVLGGGVTGLAVARLAARNGWSVTLVERGDLASGASGASSHMLHGGLRYLEHGQFGLVREALAERAAVSRMAPALARPARFLAPVHRGDRTPVWKLRAGLALYDLLAGRGAPSPHAMANAEGALALEPSLARDGLLGAGVYSDVVMDDAQLAIAVARDAAAHGAVILTRTELASARPAAGGAVELTLRDLDTRAEHGALARVIVNATGAWSDGTRRDLARMLHPGAADPPPRLRPSRGTHLVFPALTRGHGIVARAASDGRVFFVVPFAGRSLVGTTEIETASPPAAEETPPSVAEVRYLLDETARVLPGATDRAPLAVFAGVRPLLRSGTDPGAASREHQAFTDGPVVSIAGGKYTTFRLMARTALAAAAAVLGRDPGRLRDSADPLPAPLADDADAVALGARAAGDEFARTLEDALRRRSRRWLADDRGLTAAPEVASAMARRLGWSPEREREECDRYETIVNAERALIAQAMHRH
jgi:glycerol-3-phosphate dehydrogenase